MKIYKSFITATLMLFILCSLNSFVFADNEYGDYKYQIGTDGKATITKYTGNESILAIPSTLEDYEVVSIGKQAFYNTKVVEVTIPETVKTIGKKAFGYCDDLETITLAEAVIDEYAFYNCDNLKTFNGVASNVGEYAFGYDDHLEAIALAGDKICNHAFTYCSDLVTVEVQGEPIAVDSYAFYSCESLETFNGVVTEIGEYAFGYDESLNSIKLAGDKISNHAFTYCSDLVTVEVQGEPIAVDSYAFYSCESLETFNGVVTEIGEYAFGYDESLNSIKLAGDKISNHAFTYCSDLVTVEVQGEPIAVDQYAFYSCESLETFNGLISSIGEWAFGYCEDLSSLNIVGNNISENAFRSCNSSIMLFIPDDRSIEEAVKKTGMKYIVEPNLTATGSGSEIQNGAPNIVLTPDDGENKEDTSNNSTEINNDSEFIFRGNIKWGMSPYEVKLADPDATLEDSVEPYYDKNGKKIETLVHYPVKVSIYDDVYLLYCFYDSQLFSTAYVFVNDIDASYLTDALSKVYGEGNDADILERTNIYYTFQKYLNADQKSYDSKKDMSIGGAFLTMSTKMRESIHIWSLPDSTKVALFDVADIAEGNSCIYYYNQNFIDQIEASPEAGQTIITDGL